MLTLEVAGAAAAKSLVVSSVSALQHLSGECRSSKRGRLVSADDAINSAIKTCVLAGLM